MKTSLYLHIPFCRRKCSYCDFTSYDSADMSPQAYVPLLQREMAPMAQQYPLSSVVTVYFGGGTPSLLSPQSVADLLNSAARDGFSLDVDAEVTLEVNPGTVTPASLAGYRNAGVNRLSIGFQSLDEGELSLLGRIHTASQGVDTFRQARRAGFDNISIDLMHSLPGQSLARWKDTLAQATELGPEHISAYGLTIEEGTPFAAMVRRGDMAPLDPEAAADMFELTADFLTTAGYGHYEISNFARPGYCSRHNKVYWRRGNYLGFGAGAHSFVRQPGYGLRWENPPGLADYAALLQNPGSGRVQQVISREEAMAEFFFLGLRLLEGVDLAEFASEFGVEAEEVFPGVIERFVTSGLLCRNGKMLRFTRRGMMLANRVLAEFL